MAETVRGTGTTGKKLGDPAAEDCHSPTETTQVGQGSEVFTQDHPFDERKPAACSFV